MKAAVTSVTTGAAASLYYYSSRDEFKKKMDRQLLFWSTMLPVYYHYRAVECYLKMKKIESPDEKNKYFDRLHTKYSTKTLELIHALRGLYIKIGQVASVRSDVFPPQYMRELSSLQDNVPATDWSIIKSIIESELEDTLESVFLSVEETPLGAASIGQVHRAVLKDGTPVVVKVMYPDVEELFRIDIGMVTKFCRMAKPEFLPSLKEIEKQFMTEFDYRKEAQQMREIHDNIMPTYGHKVVIPTPLRATKHMLVMTEIPGVKLLDVVKQRLHSSATARGVSVETLIADNYRAAAVQAQSDEDDTDGLAPYLHWLWHSSATAYVEVYNSTAYLLNSAASWWTGTGAGATPTTSLTANSTATPTPTSPSTLSSRSPPSMDRGGGGGGVGGVWVPYISKAAVAPDPVDLLHTMFLVHGHQILVDGVFNGDPHPGNILLTPDGRLGLVDYGQVKRLTKEQRLQLARLMVGLHDKNREVVVREYTDMGIRTRDMTPDVIYSHAFLRYCSDDRKALGGVSMKNFQEQLQRRDPLESVPQDFVMVSRVAMLLRGMSYTLKYRLSTSEAWYPLAQMALHKADADGKAQGMGTGLEGCNDATNDDKQPATRGSSPVAPSTQSEDELSSLIRLIT